MKNETISGELNYTVSNGLDFFSSPSPKIPRLTLYTANKRHSLSFSITLLNCSKFESLDQQNQVAFKVLVTLKSVQTNFDLNQSLCRVTAIIK